MTNCGLNKAGRNRRDEFYTLLEDIEAELKYYPTAFIGKTVFCNCDDPFESNFFRYFVAHFNELGLKKLITISYAKSTDTTPPYMAQITEVNQSFLGGDFFNYDALFESPFNSLTSLKGDGDFRSYESLVALNEADIVVTNPPFSLFREFLGLLVKYEKQFIIMGNVNALTYKEVFPLVRDDKIWLGTSIRSGDRKFYIPDDYPLDATTCGVDESGRRYIKVKGVRWFTNVKNKHHYAGVSLSKFFQPDVYPRYENYNAINISRTAEIPCDYEGIMGVPITFLDKYSPEQFQILMLANGNARTNTDPQILKAVGYHRHEADRGGVGIVEGKRTYARLLIQRRNLVSV